LNSLDDEDKDQPKPIAPRIMLPDDTQIGFEYIQHNEPVNPNLKPTFFETAQSNFRLFNDMLNLPSIINSAYYTPPADKDYNPIESGLLDRVRPEDQDRVLATSSFYEGNAVVKKINQEYYDKDVRDRSGWFANLTTTLGASFFSPTTLIPISQTIKYGSVTGGALKNALSMSKSIVPAVALQNAVLVGSKETEGYKDWLKDTITESFIGAGIGGFLGAYAAKGAKENLGKVKATFDMAEEGIGVKYKLGQKGEVVGAEAYALPGSDVSAARVKDINNVINAVDPFKDNPMTKKFFGWSQPIIKGLTNRFGTVRELTDSLFAHNFEVAGGDITKIKGPSAENLKRLWASKVESVMLQQKQDWLEHIGAQGLFEDTRAKIGEIAGKYMSEKEYNELVGKSVRRDAQTGVPTVDRSAKRWIDEVYDPLMDELKKRRPDIAEHEYTNIKRYLNRMPDREKMASDPEGFIREYSEHLGNVSQRIWREQAPIDNLTLRNKAIRKRLKFLNERLSKSSEYLPHPEEPSLEALKAERRSLRAELSSNIQQKRRLNDSLNERIKSGEIDLEMLDERPSLTPEQTKEIERLRAPVDKAKAKLDEAIQRKKRAKDKEARAKANEEVKKARSAHAEEKAKLRRMIADEELDPALWWKRVVGEDVLYGLRNPKQVKLGRVLSPQDIKVKAQRTLDTYLQQNEEQTLGQLFESVAERGTSVLRERTVLWNDLQAEKWLVNDIETLGRAYTNQMVPRIHLDDVFLQYGPTPEKGKAQIASQIKMEYDSSRNALLSKPKSPEIEKQIKKLDKDYKDAKEFVNKMYKTYLGDLVDRSATSYRITNGIKEMGAAALLGNMPILQLTEFFTPLFEFTFTECIRDGLVPMLRYWNELRRTGKVDRMAFQDCGVGLNVALGKRTQAIMGYGAQGMPKTVVERYIKNMVGLSHNLSLANYITDLQETMVAFMSQAKTLRLIEALENGKTLSAKDIGFLDRQRIDVNKIIDLPNGQTTTLGKQILQQIKKHGDQVEGGWVANWHLWDKEAFEAQQVFKSAIEKQTRALITKPNALDTPFAFKDNQIISLATQFLSFPFAATINFTVPLLTKPDSQKLIGMLSTMAMASMVDPIRQLAKGEDIELDPKKLATSAFVNSGFFGWQLDAIQRLNAAVDLPFLRPFQGDRFRRKDPWALMGGPGAGMMSDMASMFSGAVNGEVTQRDLRNAVKLFTPFAYNWYTAQPINAMIEATGAPEKRSPRD